MKVLTVSTKGWKDDRSGEWHWTSEVNCEYDPLAFSLELHQREGIQAAIASEMDAIVNAHESRTTGPVRDRPPPVQESAAPIAPAAAAEPAPSGPRKTGDEYDSENKKWRRCVCGNENINFISSKTGAGYQACNECNLWLQSDGKVKSKGAAR